MSFTCPDCFWTSHHPQDEANAYCGHCHAFKGQAFAASPFQQRLIKALLSKTPQDNLKREVVLARLMTYEDRPMDWREMGKELLRLSFATNLTPNQYLALGEVTGVVLRNAGEIE